LPQYSPLQWRSFSGSRHWSTLTSSPRCSCAPWARTLQCTGPVSLHAGPSNVHTTVGIALVSACTSVVLLLVHCTSVDENGRHRPRQVLPARLSAHYTGLRHRGSHRVPYDDVRRRSSAGAYIASRRATFALNGRRRVLSPKPGVALPCPPRCVCGGLGLTFWSTLAQPR